MPLIALLNQRGTLAAYYMFSVSDEISILCWRIMRDFERVYCRRRNILNIPRGLFTKQRIGSLDHEISALDFNGIVKIFVNSIADGCIRPVLYLKRK